MKNVTNRREQFWTSIFMIISLLFIPTGTALAQDWASGPSMPTARAFIGACAHDGKLWVAGGYDGSSALDAFEMYNPATGAWTTKASLPALRYYHAMVSLGSLIYVIGGFNGSSTLNSVIAYDPTTNSWSDKADLLTQRHGPAAAVYSGKIYVFGGDSYGNVLNSVEVYDPSTDTWTAKSSMGTSRLMATAAVVGDKIYVAGGFQSGAGSSLSTLEIYDPLADTWSNGQDMSVKRLGSAAVGICDQVYVLGGDTYYQTLSSVEIFDPSSGAWSQGQAMNTDRRDFGAAVINGTIYAVGGFNNNNSPASYWNTMETLTTGCADLTDPGGTETDWSTALEELEEMCWSITPEELAEMLTLPFPLYHAPLVERWEDPLGMDGINLQYAHGELKGDTIRLRDLLLGETNYWLDFTFQPQTAEFVLTNLGTGFGGDFQPSSIPGIDTENMLTYLIGPPLGLISLPVGAGDNFFTIGFVFNSGRLSFSLADAYPFPEEGMEMFEGETGFSTRGFAYLTSEYESAQNYIDKKSLADLSLPSGPDWTEAIENCVSASISEVAGALNLGSSLTASAVQKVMESGTGTFLAVRDALLEGDKKKASFAYSQLIFHVLATQMPDTDKLGALLKYVAEQQDNADLAAKFANTACGVEYKELLKGHLSSPMLKDNLTDLVSAAFPLGTCIAELSMVGMKEVISNVSDISVRYLYNEWKKYGGFGDEIDYLFNERWSGFEDKIAAYVEIRRNFAAKRTGKTPSQVAADTQALQDSATKLKEIFVAWRKSESASNQTRTQLEALKQKFDSGLCTVKGTIETDLKNMGMPSPTEGDIFARYVELMQKTRNALAPYYQSEDTNLLDTYADNIVTEYMNARLDPSKPAGKAWKEAVARQIQAWTDTLKGPPGACQVQVNDRANEILVGADASSIESIMVAYDGTSILDCMCNRTAYMVFGGRYNGTGDTDCGGTGVCTTAGHLNCNDYDLTAGQDALDECDAVEFVIEKMREAHQ